MKEFDQDKMFEVDWFDKHSSTGFSEIEFQDYGFYEVSITTNGEFFPSAGILIYGIEPWMKPNKFINWE